MLAAGQLEAQDSQQQATVFNVQRFSIQDGPGIRTTFFFKGCPLRCHWCCNPESQWQGPEVAHNDSLCQKCHGSPCVRACPVSAIELSETGVAINRKACTNCGLCVPACVYGALAIYGRQTTVGELIEEARLDSPYYSTSGGGVTTCGGEPLVQPSAVAALFRISKAASFHTCLYTCGYGKTAELERILAWTDLVYFDLKIHDDQSHRYYTGKSNRLILRNLAVVAASAVPLCIRVPVIPGVTEESIGPIADLVSSLPRSAGETSIALLPYHRFGIGKYRMLDRTYKLPDLRPPDAHTLRKLLEVCQAKGLVARVEGED
ncbi:MAG: glycyl-radical enzyme activating protein [Dehalococcoidia bacterium]|nr:glycyl-radical enzyme activating protein [Dehalococcoidia bacterium]